MSETNTLSFYFVLIIMIGLCVTVGDCSCSCLGCRVGSDHRQIKALELKVNTTQSNLIELKNYLDMAHGVMVDSNGQVKLK